MKSIILLSLFLTLTIAFTGCVTDNGKYPAPTANFTPKRTYAVSYDKLWQATLDALDKNNIAVVSTDKSDGIIQTDYVTGPDTLVVLTVQNNRYKYNITLRNQPDGRIKVNIVCRIEDTYNNGHVSIQWQDETPQHMALATKLEAWLYEQIEGELKGS